MPTSQAPSLRIIDSIGSARGELRAIDTTDDTRLALTGTGTVGQTVQIHDGTTLLGTATVASNGHWLFHTGWLTDGQTYLFRASYEDGTDYSAQYQITIDAPWALAPQTPSFDVGKSVGGYQNILAFAALKDDGSVVTWGDSANGGRNNTNVDLSGGVVQVFSNDYAFAVLKDDGSVVTWGSSANGGSNNTNVDLSGGVVQVFSTSYAFAALKDDGSVVTWGNSYYGGNNNTNVDLSGGVVQVFSTGSAFAALKDDGSVVTWGDFWSGGIIPHDKSNSLSSGVVQVFSNSDDSFAALKDDGSVVTWGSSSYGGDSSSVQAQLQNIIGMASPHQHIARSNDQTAPDAPSTPLIDPASDTGAPGDGITNDTTPTITGSAEAHSLVKLYDNDGTTLLGSARADDGGLWSITPSLPLAHGIHSLLATATDAAGNTSAASAALALTIDTTAPSVPTLTVAPASDSSTAGDGITSDTTPTITGTAEAHSHITLYQGSHVVGTTTADTDGLWSITLATALAEGQHSLTATATDAAGNTSAASAALALTIDTTAPGIPTLALATTSDTGSNQGDRITSDTTPTITGTAEANSHVTLYQGSHVMGTATADTDGLWSITLATALAEGQHSLTATATDAAGNSSATSAALALTIDTAAPGIPTLALATASDTGSSQNDRITSDTTPTITGTAEANSHVTLYQGSHVVGTTTTDANGLWSITLATALAEGSHSLIATATDAAGNTSAASAALALTIDTTAPSVPIIGTPSGASNDTTPAITGTAEAHSHVTLYQGSHTLGTATADADGLWSITIGTALAKGQHILTATATDTAGNTSAASAALVLTIDTTVPFVPTLALATASDTGSHQGDRITSDTTPTITGVSEAHSHITLHNAGHTVGTATADENGSWSITLTTALPDGQHSLTAIASDAAGNVSATSTALVLTIDTTAPSAAVLSSLETRTIAGPDTVVGRLSATDAGHGALSYTLSAGPGDADNALFRIDAEAQLRLLDPAMAGAGVRSVRIAVSDAAGNVHEQVFAITVHANHAPVLTGVPADVQPVHVAATATLAGLGVADADGDALTVTLTPVNGSVEGLAQGSAQGGVVVGLEAAVWTLQGTAAGINALLANVGFSAVAVGTASLAIRVSDGHSVPASAVYAFRATDPASEADTDGDGIAAGIEAQVPGLHGGARGDGNGDGIADAQQAEVASLPWPGSGADGTLRYATLVQEAGQPLRSVVTATVPDGEGSLPAGLGLPLGSLGFAVETLPESGQGRFSLFIDGDVPVNGYFVQVAGQWVNLASGISTVGGKTRIDFEVADGSVFDRDGQTDGQLGVIGAPGWFAGNPDDLDGDQVPDRLEFGLGLKPGVKDNDVFGRDDLFVQQLYRDLLGREAEADGLAYWQEQLASNALTREQLYQSFWSSDEFQQGLSALVRLRLAETGSGPDALSLTQWRQTDGDWLEQYLEDRFGGESDAAFVTQVYASLLGRPSDDGGFQYFMNRLGAGQQERDDVVLDVLHSDEFAQTHGSGVLLETLYSGMLGRASDAGGRAYWEAYLEPGQELLEGTAWFMASTEYYERFLGEVQAVMF